MSFVCCLSCTPVRFGSKGRASRQYLPIVYFGDFWTFASDCTPVNQTTSTLPLDISFKPMSFFKWQIMGQVRAAVTSSTLIARQLDVSLGMNEAWGTSTAAESESLKRMFVETNPYLLALTFVVSLLHSVFDMLAFKNGRAVTAALPFTRSRHFVLAEPQVCGGHLCANHRHVGRDAVHHPAVPDRPRARLASPPSLLTRGRTPAG